MAILNKLQRGQEITSDILNNIIDGIRECQLQSVVGGYFRRGTGGTTITIGSPKAGEAVCPFTATIKSDGESLYASFSLGTINGILPSNIFEDIAGVTTASRNYFYIKAGSDGKAITSAIIEQTTTIRTPPTPLKDVAPAEVNILIATMATSGVVQSTIPCGNINAKIVPSIQEDNVSYVTGERNLSQYYNWIF
jgi:hypothetical protein